MWPLPCLAPANGAALPFGEPEDGGMCLLWMRWGRARSMEEALKACGNVRGEWLSETGNKKDDHRKPS